MKANQKIIIDVENAVNTSGNDSLQLPSKTLFTPTQQDLAFTHRENIFNDFTVQSLLPNYLSRQGPCMAKADVNRDGLEDLFIGGAKGQPSELFLQQTNGKFVNKKPAAFLADAEHEDVAAEFFDADNDQDMDLYVGSGGYEFAENDVLLQDRLYLNDGRGNFTKNEKALPLMPVSTGCVKSADLDTDGDMDLFIGARLVPGKYPQTPSGKILLNNGKAQFTDATSTVLPALNNLGMVTDALWTDLNNDKTPDLVVVGDWMPLKIFINRQGKLADASSGYIKFASTGWWNRIAGEDFDGDGDQDLVIGNLGLNAQFKAAEKEPACIYYKDFDGNGTVDPIFCYYIQGVSYPAFSRDDLTEQLPGLKKKYLTYKDFASATVTDIFSQEQLKDAALVKAEMQETVYLENTGNEFKKKQLPIEAQYAPTYAISVLDANHDGKKDLLLTGNNSHTRIKFGRYTANNGTFLSGDGRGGFSFVPQYQNGLNVRGDVRSSVVIHTRNGDLVLLGKNDGAAEVYKY